MTAAGSLTSPSPTSRTGRGSLSNLKEAFPFDQVPRYLIRDNDGVYGQETSRCLKSLGIEEVTTTPGSPWENAFVERLIGTLRRELLDHVIVLNARHLEATAWPNSSTATITTRGLINRSAATVLIRATSNRSAMSRRSRFSADCITAIAEWRELATAFVLAENTASARPPRNPLLQQTELRPIPLGLVVSDPLQPSNRRTKCAEISALDVPTCQDGIFGTHRTRYSLFLSQSHPSPEQVPQRYRPGARRPAPLQSGHDLAADDRWGTISRKTGYLSAAETAAIMRQRSSSTRATWLVSPS